MKDYPLQGTTVTQVNELRAIVHPSYVGENLSSSQNEFHISVAGVGDFYAADGNRIEYSPVPGADPDWVKLYLNGQLLVALLHQRRIISFHASSFIHKGRGIMVLGETGAGKSSLTVAFALENAGFLTDDLTPVVFKNERPCLWPLGREVKLRESTIGELKISDRSLKDAEAGTGKQYLHLEQAEKEHHPLEVILKIEVGDTSSPEFQELNTAEKFSDLRSEICSWEILAGMPETEADYLRQLVQIIEKVQFVRVVRPANIRIAEMHEAVKEFLLRKG
jgi:hypothetical protein